MNKTTLYSEAYSSIDWTQCPDEMLVTFTEQQLKKYSQCLNHVKHLPDPPKELVWRDDCEFTLWKKSIDGESVEFKSTSYDVTGTRVVIHSDGYIDFILELSDLPETIWGEFKLNLIDALKQLANAA